MTVIRHSSPWREKSVSRVATVSPLVAKLTGSSRQVAPPSSVEKIWGHGLSSPLAIEARAVFSSVKISPVIGRVASMSGLGEAQACQLTPPSRVVKNVMLMSPPSVTSELTDT